MNKTIGLIDCDSFFASCEQADNPDIKNKPVCVLSMLDDKGIVIARSKQAKSIGIKMCEPYFKIKHQHKNIIYLASRMDRYKQISTQIMAIIKSFSPDVEVTSIDEAYIDFTSLNKVYKKNYIEIAQAIRSTILAKTSIPVSIGISSSKTLAKLASNLAKENGGIFFIPSNQVLEKIGNLTIDKICGIGKKHNKRLQVQGVFDIKDFIQKDDTWIRKTLGISGLELKHELLGYEVSKINNQPQAPKSIQSTSTFYNPTNDIEILQQSLSYHTHQASKKLRTWDGFCKSISIMLKAKDFTSHIAKQKLFVATNSEQEIASIASNLLKRLYKPNTIYRSSGVTIEEVDYPNASQLNLFEGKKYKDDKLSRTIDELEAKFGKNIIKNGWI